MLAGRSGSGSHQILRPLPADDRARPPSEAGTGARPFLPPAAHDRLAQVEHGIDRPAPESPRPVDDDSEPTTPLPVILPGAAAILRPDQVETPRGPFEAASTARPTSVAGSMEPPRPHLNGVAQAAGSLANGAPVEPSRAAVGAGSQPPEDLARVSPASRSIPDAASEKLDQIKDLYLTAEAIGEQALDKHFDQVRQRQRELIKEFFEQSRPADGEAP